MLAIRPRRHKEHHRPKHGRRSRGLARVEFLESRELLSLSASGGFVFGTEGASLTQEVATFSDSDLSVTLADLSATIDWGDGSGSSGGQVSAISSGNYAVTGTHAYAEFSPAEGYIVSVTIHDTKNALATLAEGTASIQDAPLYPGNPVSPGTPQSFSGTGTAGVGSAIGSFQSAVGWRGQRQHRRAPDDGFSLHQLGRCETRWNGLRRRREYNRH